MRLGLRFCIVLTLATAARSGLLPAQSCPAISFLTAPQLAPSANEIIVAVRQANGSFTEYGLLGSAPSYTIPNIQNSFVGCLPVSSSKGPKTTINLNPVGMPSEPGAIADLNGNGTPELLVAEQGPGVTIYWDFNLTAPTTLLPQVTNPAGVSVADLNGDGKPDVVVLDAGAGGTANTGGVYVLLNNGDKTFTLGGHYALSGPGSVAIADINGDGKPDLAIAQEGVYNAGTTTGMGVAILLGNGDGTFQSPTVLPNSSVPIAVMLADFNRDGKMDLAVNTLGSNGQKINPISILLGDGKGNFTQFATVQPGGDAMTMTTGDFNGDGIPDIATGNFQIQTVSVMLGKGDGSFGAATSYAAPYGPTEITVTDFNNDGIADIAIGVGGPSAIGESENSNVIGVLLGNGDGSFQGAPTYDIGGSVATFLAVADFNGDGKVDAIVGADSGAFDFFAGNGDGTFQNPIASTTQGSGPAATGDFNGDGRPDIALATSTGIQILLNHGGATFQSPMVVSSGGTNPAGIVVADFNGDGKLDLAVANLGDQTNQSQVQAGNVVILTGAGNGGFAPANTYSAGTAPTSIATADLNGDGKPDLVVADAGVNTFGSTLSPTAGAIYVLLNQGGGAFKAAASYSFLMFPIAVAIGDVNKDGKPDLVVLSLQETNANTTYEAGILLGNGDGTFQAAIPYQVDFGPMSTVIADFNGDGKPDIVIAHCCGDTQTGYLLGHGDGTFDPEVLFDGGPSPALLAVADINNDGKADLLVAGSSGDSASFTPLLNESIKAVPLAIACSAPAPTGTGVAAESIASAYGSDLATQTITATTVGTSLGGTSVSVKDSTGTTRASVLFFVSPGQVNFQVPAGTANGAATVTVQSSGGTSASGTVRVNTVAPGIYTANANGLAAALAFSYKPDGTYTYQDTAILDSGTNQIVPNPISLDPKTNQVYLQLYGTGLRNAAAGSVTVKVGSMILTPRFYGAQGEDPGLDQVNVLLPYSLKGSGDVAVVVTAGGVTANTVHVTIQ